jgi:hypothetical protein
MSGINTKIQGNVARENQKHAVGLFSTPKEHGRTWFKHSLASFFKSGLQITRNSTLCHDALTFLV